jgi:hypothetical protein
VAVAAGQELLVCRGLVVTVATVGQELHLLFLEQLLLMQGVAVEGAVALLLLVLVV